MLRSLLTACAAVLLVAAIVGGTSDAFQASLSGLSLWWNFVFPALLPFLVLAELMLAFGLSDGLGALMAPLTSRLLRLPGTAGWAIVQGWTGGFPAGAHATAELISSSRITPSQGQRLLAVSHLPNPLFVVVVIGAGFLHQPLFGLMLLPLLWISSLLTGLVLSLGAKERLELPPSHSDKVNNEDPTNAPGESSRSGLLLSALTAMEAGRRRDGRSFGKALGDGVASAVQKLMSAGGLIILSAVVIRLLQPVLPAALEGPLLSAFTEAHLGAGALASWHAPESASLHAAVFAAALSWGGLCALLQATGAAAGTGIKLLPLAAARLLAGALAAGITLMLWKPLHSIAAFTAPGAAEPVFHSLHSAGGWLTPGGLASLWPSALYTAPLLAGAFVLMLLISAAASAFLRLHRGPVR